MSSAASRSRRQGRASIDARIVDNGGRERSRAPLARAIGARQNPRMIPLSAGAALLACTSGAPLTAELFAALPVGQVGGAQAGARADRDAPSDFEGSLLT